MKNFLLFIAAILFASGYVYAQETAYEVGYKQKGTASFYDQDLHRKKLASGEEYDMFSMTAAHPSIPFNSIIKVTNLKNDKWVTLRINDRGPFTKARILDVSKRAALKLDMVADGTTEVEVELLKVGDNRMIDEASGTEATAQKTEGAAKTAGPTVASATDKDEPKTTGQKQPSANKKTPVASATTKAKGTAATTKTATKKAKASKAPKNAVPLLKRFENTGTYNIWGTKANPSGYGLQLGAYSDIATAHKIAKEAKGLGLEEIYIQSGWTQGEPSYRVLFGSEEDKKALEPMVEEVKKKGFMGTFARKHL